MSTTRYTKDPDDELRYGVDWSDWLDEGETIASSSWAVETATGTPADDLAVMGSPAPQNSGTGTTAYLEKGVLGIEYTVRNRITTTENQQADRSFVVYIRNR